MSVGFAETPPNALHPPSVVMWVGREDLLSPGPCPSLAGLRVQVCTMTWPRQSILQVYDRLPTGHTLKRRDRS